MVTLDDFLGRYQGVNGVPLGYSLQLSVNGVQVEPSQHENGRKIYQVPVGATLGISWQSPDARLDGGSFRLIMHPNLVGAPVGVIFDAEYGRLPSLDTATHGTVNAYTLYDDLRQPIKEIPLLAQEEQAVIGTWDSWWNVASGGATRIDCFIIRPVGG